MEIVCAAETDIKQLMARYFAAAPPFEGSGKKKNEFPDAIALLSLEAWAKAKSKTILAISNDGGWASFAEDSEHIDLGNDLAARLPMLSEHAAQAGALVAFPLAEMEAGCKTDVRPHGFD